MKGPESGIAARPLVEPAGGDNALNTGGPAPARDGMAWRRSCAGSEFAHIVLSAEDLRDRASFEFGKPLSNAQPLRLAAEISRHAILGRTVILDLTQIPDSDFHSYTKSGLISGLVIGTRSRKELFGDCIVVAAEDSGWSRALVHSKLCLLPSVRLVNSLDEIPGWNSGKESPTKSVS